MAQTYAQLQEEIARLEEQGVELRQQAASIRAQELSSVIHEVTATMAEYSITAEQLGFKLTGGKKSKRAPSTALYGDDKGNTWGGRGKRPHWLEDAGGDIERFRL